MRRPGGSGIKADSGHSWEAGFHSCSIALEHLGIALRLDTKDQFLALRDGLHRLGGELRHARDKRHVSREYILRCGVQYDPRFSPDGYPASERFGQEKGHIDIAEIEDREELATSGQHLTGLCHAVLHTSAARCLEDTVLDLGLQPLSGGERRFDVGLRLHYLGFGQDRKSTRLNSSHVKISYAVFCLKKKK